MEKIEELYKALPPMDGEVHREMYRKLHKTIIPPMAEPPRTQYSQLFDGLLDLYIRANTVYGMTTKFWSADWTDGTNQPHPMVCCKINIMKSRADIQGIETVLILDYQWNSDDTPRLWLSMNGHRCLSEVECKRRLKLSSILEDDENRMMVKMFHEQLHVHGKLLLCPLSNSMDNDLIEYLKNGSKPLIK